MKKLYLLSILVLTTLGLFYSCSAEEEDTAPPASVVTTPEPEPPAPTTNTYYVSVNYGEEIEGGNLSIDGDEYEEGTDLSIVATPDDGYYFYAWKNVTVTGVDSSGNDSWGRHSSYGSFDNEIQITVNNKFNIIPIFLEKSPINQEKSWDFQGFVTTGWSGLGYNLLIDGF